MTPSLIEMRRLDWETPASLLQRVAVLEKVHPIESIEQLRDRLDEDRAAFALFHRAWTTSRWPSCGLPSPVASPTHSTRSPTRLRPASRSKRPIPPCSGAFRRHKRGCPPWAWATS
ncbi:MAG: malonyl-CoA decarboxylase family protein [Candidatus Microthrix sp.]|uniref:Malonyl-CoA decarboxylase family protein n=1 Tax=Candidatus Neomicrothrix subdominans TaxID=2954438 RepID=A0A936TFP0_9ACTN|nr:malonyl-CoA decarboxylase family protein [Candidatus Microthrix subdominans]